MGKQGSHADGTEISDQNPASAGFFVVYRPAQADLLAPLPRGVTRHKVMRRGEEFSFPRNSIIGSRHTASPQQPI